MNQLSVITCDLFFTGSNSSALSSNASSPTSSNGVGNQLAPTNITTGNSSSNPVALNSTHAPTTHKSTTRTVNSKEPVKTGIGSSATITPMKDENSVSEKPESTTTPIVGGVSSPAKRSDDEGNVYSSRKYPNSSHGGSLEIWQKCLKESMKQILCGGG